MPHIRHQSQVEYRLSTLLLSQLQIKKTKTKRLIQDPHRPLRFNTLLELRTQENMLLSL